MIIFWVFLVNLWTGPATFSKKCPVVGLPFNSYREIRPKVRRTVVLKILIGPHINHEFSLKITLGMWSGNIKKKQQTKNWRWASNFWKTARFGESESLDFVVVEESIYWTISTNFTEFDWQPPAHFPHTLGLVVCPGANMFMKKSN